MQFFRRKSSSGLYECPCCGYAMFVRADGCEVCQICYWEDDGSDDGIDPIDPLNHYELNVARVNYLTFGASDPKFREVTRAPVSSDERLRSFVLIDGCAVEVSD